VVARDLLGKTLVRQLESGELLAGIVVEVEAYLPAMDPASHSFRGAGKRNASMFEPAGTLYVYAIHAKYCLNVVTEVSGQGAAVLIRAVQPIKGVSRMKQARAATIPDSPLKNLTSGPGRLCQALGVDRSLDGENLLTSSRLWLESQPAVVAVHAWTARTSGRIGISQATEMQLRWFIDGHSFVSGRARDHSRRRDWFFDVCPRLNCLDP